MKKIHWRDDAKEMTFEDFKRFHINLFANDEEAKKAFKEIGGKEKAKKKEEKEGGE